MPGILPLTIGHSSHERTLSAGGWRAWGNGVRQVAGGAVQAAFPDMELLEPIGADSGSGECWKIARGGQTYVLKLVVHEHEPGRFAREIAGLERVSSSYVMRVHDYGSVEVGTQNYPYFVGEYIPGGNLRDRLVRRAPQDGLFAMAGGLLKGLDDLHGCKVVHRDIKPENIAFRDGSWASPVIIDLGLARLLDSASFTVYPWAYGTWPYMAPEQLAAERAITRTDLWSWAVVTCESALGRHPFRRPTDHPRTIPPDWSDRLRTGREQAAALLTGELHAAVLAAFQMAAYRRPSAGELKRRLG